ncbi:MAG: hypothetical protein ACR2ML_04885 [Solirubrobacteraceae bacterium]
MRDTGENQTAEQDARASKSPEMGEPAGDSSASAGHADAPGAAKEHPESVEKAGRDEATESDA